MEKNYSRRKFLKDASMASNGTHEVDLCLWALDVKYPLKVSASGGRYHFRDDWEFYDTLVTNFEYEDKMITWEGKSCNDMKYFGRGRGVSIHGTEGTMVLDRNGYEIYSIGGEKLFVYEKPEKDETLGIAGGGPMTDRHFKILSMLFDQAKNFAPRLKKVTLV